MTEQELRTLVRQAIVRVKGTGSAASPHLVHPSQLQHSSHLTFAVASGADADGPCIIEPTVMCNHCGYCKSLGH
jgi:hypothetical protein